MSETIDRQLGTITAHLENIKETQKEQGASFKSIDERLRTVERKAAIAGIFGGGVMAVAVGLIKNSFPSS